MKRAAENQELKSPSTNKRFRSTTSIESLPQEVLIRCLSHLSAHDLASCSLLSTEWRNLSLESSLWKRLYLTTYSRELENGKVERERPWRELYKISSNWKTGKMRRSRIGLDVGVMGSAIRQAVLPAVASDLEMTETPLGPATSLQPSASSDPILADPCIQSAPPVKPNSLLQFRGNIFISASTAPALAPDILVHRNNLDDSTELLGTFASSVRASDETEISITELRLDEMEVVPESLQGARQAQNDLRLFISYSNGQFSIFEIELSTFSANEIYTCSPPRLYSTVFDPISIARMHYPLLVTCTESFIIKLFRISSHDDKLELVELGGSWRSEERNAPVSLSLVALSVSEFIITLSYSLPLFPFQHTVGIQTFNLSFTPTRVVIKSRFATAPIEINSSVWSQLNQRRRQVGFKVAAVTGIEENDGYLATSSDDNSISIFQILGRGSTEKLSVQFIRKLFGNSAVDSIALSPNRCISSAGNSIKIWNLEKSTGIDLVEEADVIEQIVGTTLANSFTLMKEKRSEKGRGRMITLGAFSDGRIGPRDYGIRYSTSYSNTLDFCTKFRAVCINTVGALNFHHQLDCVLDQPGPTIFAFCGGVLKELNGDFGNGPVLDLTTMVCPANQGCEIISQPSQVIPSFNAVNSSAISLSSSTETQASQPLSTTSTVLPFTSTLVLSTLPDLPTLFLFPHRKTDSEASSVRTQARSYTLTTVATSDISESSTVTLQMLTLTSSQATPLESIATSTVTSLEVLPIAEPITSTASVTIAVVESTDLPTYSSDLLTPSAPSIVPASTPTLAASTNLVRTPISMLAGAALLFSFGL